ncbi:MAG: hypothetical protein VB858_00595, partial [Planctomycetaceae bacterium]
PPAGAARARTTPSSWRTSRPVDNPGIFQHSDFQAPVHPSKRIEPTTLMIPTIPDNEKTRQVHWLPEQQ